MSSGAKLRLNNSVCTARLRQGAASQFYKVATQIDATSRAAQLSRLATPRTSQLVLQRQTYDHEKDSASMQLDANAKAR